jgi:hypothetical protein
MGLYGTSQALKSATLDAVIPLFMLYGSNTLLQDTSNTTGEFEHPVIQAITNGAWFRDPNGHGVKYGQYFTSRLPLPSPALVLTSVGLSRCMVSVLTYFQIEVVLDEWKTGKERRVVFSEAEYRTKFEGHLNTLKAWGRAVPFRMEEICKDLLSNARSVPPT